MVKTPCSQYRGHGLILSLFGEQRSCMPHGAAKKKKRNKIKNSRPSILLSPFHSLFLTNYLSSPKNISHLVKTGEFYVGYSGANNVNKIISFFFP